jgi:hypothetical protein
VNVIEGEPDERPMTTGKHTVRDIYCCKCGTTLGWKYVNVPFDLTPTPDSHRACRTRRTISLRSTRKANISLSVISSWTFSRYHAQSPTFARTPSWRYYTFNFFTIRPEVLNQPAVMRDPSSLLDCLHQHQCTIERERGC